MKELTGNERVLVRLPSWLGDSVAAEPTVRVLYQRACEGAGPESLGLVAPGHLLDVFDGMFPGAQRIPCGSSGGRARDWRGFDLAVLLTGSFRSAWTAFRAGIPRRLGWARDGRGFLLTDSLSPASERGLVPSGLGIAGRHPRYLPRPFATTCAELLTLVGLETPDSTPQLEVESRVLGKVGVRMGKLGLDLDEPYLVVNAGSRPGSSKAWPASLWARMLDSLALEAKLPVVLVCGPGEEAALAEIVERTRYEPLIPLFEPAVNLAELTALSSQAALVVSTDTGPRHVAAAAGAPVVAICGSTDPRHTSDQLARTTLVRVEVPCGPCHLEVCPLEGAELHACMRLVDPERVLTAMRPWLAGLGTNVFRTPTDTPGAV